MTKIDHEWRVLAYSRSGQGHSSKKGKYPGTMLRCEKDYSCALFCVKLTKAMGKALMDDQGTPELSSGPVH
jgi:hypothetical protein